MDDGSTDTTRKLSEKFALKDPRITILSSSRVGVAGALNRGIHYSTAPYIARQDGDDVSAAERLQKQLTYLENHPECGVVGSWARLIDEMGIDVGRITTPVEHEEILECLKVKNCVVHGSIMLRSELLKNNGSYAEQRHNIEDYDLWTRLIPLTRFHALPECLYHYRVHTGSVTGTRYQVMRGDTKEAADRFCEDSSSIHLAEQQRNSFLVLVRSCAQSGWFFVLGQSLIKQARKRPSHSLRVLLAMSLGIVCRMFTLMKACVTSIRT